MRRSEREERLWKMAEQDGIYITWKRCFEECEQPFKEYADACPEEIRQILYGYAECGRMMCQSVVNLACKYMDFLDGDDDLKSKTES